MKLVKYIIHGEFCTLLYCVCVDHISATALCGLWETSFPENCFLGVYKFPWWWFVAPTSGILWQKQLWDCYISSWFCAGPGKIFDANPFQLIQDHFEWFKQVSSCPFTQVWRMWLSQVSHTIWLLTKVANHPAVHSETPWQVCDCENYLITFQTNIKSFLPTYFVLI